MENEKNRLVLNEVIRMNRLQRAKEQSIDEMSDQITYYQDLFDTVIANNKNTNQSIIREIRANLLRLSILADPKMRTRSDLILERESESINRVIILIY